MRLYGEQAVTVFCMAMDIPHIFNAIDPRFKSFLGVRVLCRDIFKGLASLWCIQQGRKLGIVWGYPHADGMELHVGFDHHMDVLECCRAIEGEIRSGYPYIRKFYSLIPEENRSARVLALKMGYAETGVEEYFGNKYVRYEKSLEVKNG